MLTDNRILVERLKELPALMCVQRKAQKKIVTEEDAIQSNIDSFGDDIGKTTNWITSMFDVRAQYEPGSAEYRELDYRIKCGQLFQQNAIDKAKGIISKPMPREWHDRRSAAAIEDPQKRHLYLSLVADKKPYFMRYIYPALMRQYNTFVKNTNKNALREFGLTVDELKAVPPERKTERQKEFLRYYRARMPVGDNDCVMNRICRRFEREFDGYVGKSNAKTSFDYRIMRSGAEYTQAQFSAISRLCKNYNKQLQNYAVFAKYERVSECDALISRQSMLADFELDCAKVCPDRRTLCDIVLDVCYQKSATKRFAWELCGAEIIQNLLSRNGGVISYPELDENGAVAYGGNRFTVKRARIGGEQ